MPGSGPLPFVILLVDDRPFVAEAVQRLLNGEADISFHYCKDPFQALEVAEKIDPTLILLDLMMPDIDGLTLCRFFRAHPFTRDKPVIMLSSSEDPPAKIEAFIAGANDYLVKLPDKIELLARVRYYSVAYINKKERDKANLLSRASQGKLGELYTEISKLSRHDELTGLSNRHAFEERYKELWCLAMRHEMHVSVMMMDLDHFKLFNEYYGHQQGDECLKSIAKVFQQSIRRPSDVLARFSGEKFIALLPATPTEGAMHVAELIRSGVENLGIPHCKNDLALLTISLGVASAVPVRGANMDALLKLAVDCLNRSKELGRNRFETAY